MVKNLTRPTIFSSLVPPNPEEVDYWIDLLANAKGNIIKFWDGNIRKWVKLTDASSEYAIAPHIGTNGNWFVENRDTGIKAYGYAPIVGDNDNWWQWDAVLGKYIDTGVPVEGPIGPVGPQGKSAYEVALDNGFVGTEDEWLQSLKQASEDAAEVALLAAQDAVEATDDAIQATADANHAASDAVMATAAAEAATIAAQNATHSANTATSNANTAANTANTAATNANQKADIANTAATNANTAAQNAIDATADANAAITLANTATTNANNAATNANEKAEDAENAAQEARDAIAGIENGKTPVISDIEVVSVASTAPATFELTDTGEVDGNGNPIYEGYAEFPKGVDGKTPVMEAGTTTTGNPGTNANVTVTPNGTTPEDNPKYTINFTIPRGAQGEPGDGAGNVVITNAGVGLGTSQYAIRPNADGSLNYSIEEVVIPNLDDYVKKADIVNNLTSEDIDKPLSAAQGKMLQDSKQDAIKAASSTSIPIFGINGLTHFVHYNANPVGTTVVARTPTSQGKFAPAINDDEAIVKSQLDTAVTDINTSINLKADKDYVDTGLEGKQDGFGLPTVTNSVPVFNQNGIQLWREAHQAVTSESIAVRAAGGQMQVGTAVLTDAAVPKAQMDAEITTLNTAINTKASNTYVDEQLALKGGKLDTSGYSVPYNNSSTVGEPVNSLSVQTTSVANSIPLRNANGQFTVGTPTTDNHVATKKYVDDSIDGLVHEDELVVALEGKQDSFGLPTSSNHIPVFDENGFQLFQPFADAAIQTAIARRVTGGQLRVGTAVLSDAAVPKAQMDALLAEKADLVSGKIPSSQLPEITAQVNSDWDSTSGVSQILNKPASMPASDVYSWAKSSTKPAYAYSEITGTKPPTDAQKNSDITKAEIEDKLTGTITSHSHTVIKDNVGLGNVDNTSDADKPVSTAVAAALVNKASLVSGKVPASELPSYVDDVLEGVLHSATEFRDVMNNVIEPESGKIYIDVSTDKSYRWGGSLYAEISKSLAIGETSTTAFAGNRGLALEIGKVDKISGKGLSTNDYTNDEKSEVAKIANKADLGEDGKVLPSQLPAMSGGLGKPQEIKLLLSDATPTRTDDGNYGFVWSLSTDGDSFVENCRFSLSCEYYATPPSVWSIYVDYEGIAYLNVSFVEEPFPEYLILDRYTGFSNSAAPISASFRYELWSNTHIHQNIGYVNAAMGGMFTLTVSGTQNVSFENLSYIPLGKSLRIRIKGNNSTNRTITITPAGVTNELDNTSYQVNNVKTLELDIVNFGGEFIMKGVYHE